MDSPHNIAFPNESVEFRQKRNELLKEEIELQQIHFNLKKVML